MLWTITYVVHSYVMPCMIMWWSGDDSDSESDIFIYTGLQISIDTFLATLPLEKKQRIKKKEQGRQCRIKKGGVIAIIRGICNNIVAGKLQFEVWL